MDTRRRRCIDEAVQLIEYRNVVLTVEVLPQVCDLSREDQTGYVWAFLDEARDPSIVAPGALVVAGDEDATAVAVVVDLVSHPNGTIVHLDVLSGRDRRVPDAGTTG